MCAGVLYDTTASSILNLAVRSVKPISSVGRRLRNRYQCILWKGEQKKPKSIFGAIFRKLMISIFDFDLDLDSRNCQPILQFSYQVVMPASRQQDTKPCARDLRHHCLISYRLLWYVLPGTNREQSHCIAERLTKRAHAFSTYVLAALLPSIYATSACPYLSGTCWW